jgi:hypothetical protein
MVATGEGTGGCGVRTVCLHPNISGPSNLPYNFQVTTDVSGGVVVWGTDATDYQAFDTDGALKDYSQGVRVVSAAIYVQSLASLATNSGSFTCYNRPFPPVLMVDTNDVPAYQNLYKSTIVPINLNQACTTRWYPVKQDGASYDMFYIPQQPAGPNWDNDGPDCPFWEMGVIVEGAAEGTAFEFIICVNYEFLPKQNAINILDATPSPVDAQEVDLVENWVQDMPATGSTSNKVVDTPPQVSMTPEPGFGTGFGMFAEVISEIAPIALALL